MSAIRMLDRMVYRCPEITQDIQNKYPLIEAYVQGIDMWTPQCMYTQNTFVYAYVQVSEDGEPFIDVYKCAYSDCNDRLFQQRFVWKRGSRLSVQDEEELMTLLNGDEKVFFLDDNLDKFVFDCRRLFVDLNIPDFCKKSMYIQYMYFSLQPGNYERLYKSGLFEIAKHIEEVDDIDIGMKCSNLSKVFGVPMRLMKILNTSWGIEFLKTRESRNMICTVYEKYRDYMDFKGTSQSQIRYLCDIEQGKIKHLFDKNIYRFIGETICDETYQQYMHYLDVVEMVKEYYPMEKVFDNEDEYMRRHSEAIYLESLIEREEDINRRLAEIRYMNEEIICDDGQYIVQILDSVKDILKEASHQKNCLINYIVKCVCGPSVIVTIRKSNAPQDSFITAEYIYGEKFMMEIKGKQNRDITDPEMEWIEEYCRIKSIKISKKYIDKYPFVNQELIYRGNEKLYEYTDDIVDFG